MTNLEAWKLTCNSTDGNSGVLYSPVWLSVLSVHKCHTSTEWDLVRLEQICPAHFNINSHFSATFVLSSSFASDFSEVRPNVSVLDKKITPVWIAQMYRTMYAVK